VTLGAGVPRVGAVRYVFATSAAAARGQSLRPSHTGVPAPTSFARMRADHRRALGALGERIASRHLGGKGYEVIDRNFRTRYGELDLVAVGRGFLVFCEVKTRVGRRGRANFGPLASVGARKRSRLRGMAREWLAKRSGQLQQRPRQIRFDAVGVTVTPTGRLLALEHLEGAF
jgi:putative endonuclease